MQDPHRLGHIHDERAEVREAQRLERLGVRLLPHGAVDGVAPARQRLRGVVPDAGGGPCGFWCYMGGWSWRVVGLMDWFIRIDLGDRPAKEGDG